MLEELRWRRTGRVYFAEGRKVEQRFTVDVSIRRKSICPVHTLTEEWCGLARKRIFRVGLGTFIMREVIERCINEPRDSVLYLCVCSSSPRNDLLATLQVDDDVKILLD
jgi:hypothetical protein